MVLISVAAFLALVLALGTVLYLRFDSKIKTFSPKGLTTTPPKLPATLNSANILLIGSDSRSGANSSLGGKGTAVGRSDTTLLVHVYADHKRAVAVSIPRDSLVTIPRCLLPDGSWTTPQHDVMFNAAFSVGQTSAGNPQCTQNTVTALTGLKIDHTIVANFAGFAAMSTAVGGVPVCLPHAVYQGDLNPNLKAQGRLLFRAGVQKVSGDRALQYVRIRHGLGDSSDIGRIRRQQAFLASLIRTVRAQGLTSSHLLPLVDAATKNLTFDPTLGNPAKLLSFALSLRHIAPADITFVTVPWRYDGARVAIRHPDAEQLWQALQKDQTIGTQHTGGGTQGHHHGHGLPPSVTQGSRTGDTKVCSDLVYG
ncbi:MAG: LCP family protein [Nocardioidaceae bacterium]